MDDAAATFHNLFSSIHKALFLLYVLSIYMETSSESDYHALLVRFIAKC